MTNTSRVKLPCCCLQGQQNNSEFLAIYSQIIYKSLANHENCFTLFCDAPSIRSKYILVSGLHTSYKHYFSKSKTHILGSRFILPVFLHSYQLTVNIKLILRLMTLDIFRMFYLYSIRLQWFKAWIYNCWCIVKIYLHFISLWWI